MWTDVAMSGGWEYLRSSDKIRFPPQVVPWGWLLDTLPPPTPKLFAHTLGDEDDAAGFCWFDTSLLSCLQLHHCQHFLPEPNNKLPFT